MPTPDIVANLCSILAELYPDLASIRRVFVDARLNITWIKFEFDPRDNWHTVLSEVERTNEVNELFALVLNEHGANIKLRQAVAAYRASIEQSNNSKRTSSSTNAEINTGSGPYVAGDISTSGGDFVGRDKTTQGDDVGRDKAGRDIYNFNGPVTINQTPEERVKLSLNKVSGSQDKTIRLANSSIDSDKQIDIFLSYSHIDMEIMQRLRDDLRAAGFTVWTDDVGLEPGTPSWQRAIEEAIQAARCIVVLLSPEAKQSRWVEIEVSTAEDFGLRVFPVLVRGDDRNAVLFRLRTTQRVDIRHDYQVGVQEQLIPALRRHLQKLKPIEVIETKSVKVLEATKSTRTESPKVTKTEPVQSRKANELKQNKIPYTIERPTTDPSVFTFFSLLNFMQLVTMFAAIILFIFLFRVFFSGLSFQDFLLGVAPTQVPMPATTVITKTNPIDDAVYVWIPPGEFMMGSGVTDTLAISTEGPQHKVSLEGFWIMRTEVTNGQYKQCVRVNKCTEPVNDRWDKSEFSNYPVANINWYQANIYAEWVGGYLPTEAQWEKAARGKEDFIYPWGNEWDGNRLNYCDSNCLKENTWRDPTINDGYPQTAPVGSYPTGASPYGAFDMAGNVWEWTSSQWQYPYQADDICENASSKEKRVVRGGSWFNERLRMRTAYRYRYCLDYQDDDVGFRVISLSF